MNDFDFLRDHGYGVVYGEKAVRQLIIDLAIKSPIKERNMTYEQATADLAVTEAPVSAVAEVTASLSKHFGVDAEGNLVEEVGYVTDEGAVATPADVTVN